MNYLQFNDRGKFEPEEQALAAFFGEGNYIGFYKKHFLRDKFSITKDDFISGDIDVMFHAMKRLGIEYSYNDYPESLKPYLHRKVWESTLGEVRKKLFNDLGNEVELGLNWFIKPKDKLKRFTGFVCETIDDLQYVNGAGNQTKIWCSEPVIFTDEFRCYIRKHKGGLDTKYELEAIGNYKGNLVNKNKMNDFSDVLFKILDDISHESQKFFEDRGGNLFPSAFALDLGILSTGDVALIEMNDAFSIGKYNGISDETYAKFVITRWNELCSTVK